MKNYSNVVFEKTNLQYIIDYDYERSACTCDDDYCRCTTIERSWIESIDVSHVIAELSKKYVDSANKIDKYCFDRICYINKIYDKDFYEIEHCAGYYGEEVGGVYFDNEEKLVKEYNELIALSSAIEKVKYCLELEYGYLIDRVSTCTHAYVEHVDSAYVHLPNTEYFVRLKDTVIDSYKNRSLPVAVCVKDGIRYRLLDGYHRFVANSERDVFDVIVLE